MKDSPPFKKKKVGSKIYIISLLKTWREGRRLRLVQSAISVDNATKYCDVGINKFGGIENNTFFECVSQEWANKYNTSASHNQGIGQLHSPFSSNLSFTFATYCEMKLGDSC